MFQIALAIALSIAVGVYFERKKLASQPGANGQNAAAAVLVQPGQTTTVSVGSIVQFAPTIVPTGFVASDATVLQQTLAPVGPFKAIKTGTSMITATDGTTTQSATVNVV